jgi:hypothetical protein
MRTFKVLKDYFGIEAGTEVKTRDNQPGIRHMIKYGYWEETTSTDVQTNQQDIENREKKVIEAPDRKLKQVEDKSAREAKKAEEKAKRELERQIRKDAKK